MNVSFYSIILVDDYSVKKYTGYHIHSWFNNIFEDNMIGNYVNHMIIENKMDEQQK